jgi:TM2 domain-containing membrane protein YozV
MEMEKVWVIEDPDEYLNSLSTRRTPKEAPFPDEKDPALAYTLSLLFWGGGQLYNGQRTKGLNYIALALYGNALAILLFMFQEDLPFYLRFISISPAQALLAAAFLLVISLIFWVLNASDAYHTAIKARRTPFPGVSTRAWPLFCSLLVPGWGQFLNAQPVKGGLFAIGGAFGIFSFIAVPGILYAWPSLEISDFRIIVEGVLLLSLLLLPATPVLWVLSVFDAWKVGQDDIKKEPFLERLKAANNRRRAYGWVRGVFPQIKRTLLLALFLIILIVIIDRSSFVWSSYREYLDETLKWSAKQGMVLIPELVRRIITMLPAK